VWGAMNSHVAATRPTVNARTNSNEFD